MENKNRTAAISRILATPELRPIQSLENIHFEQADTFWHLLATGAISDIAPKSEYITVAYHEATYAIAGWFTSSVIVVHLPAGCG